MFPPDISQTRHSKSTLFSQIENMPTFSMVKPKKAFIFGTIQFSSFKLSNESAIIVARNVTYSFWEDEQTQSPKNTIKPRTLTKSNTS